MYLQGALFSTISPRQKAGSVEGRLFRKTNACSYICFVFKMALLFFSFSSSTMEFLFIYLFLPGCFTSALRVWRSQNNKHPLPLPRVELILGTPCSSNITLQVNHWWNFVQCVCGGRPTLSNISPSKGMAHYA